MEGGEKRGENFTCGDGDLLKQVYFRDQRFPGNRKWNENKTHEASPQQIWGGGLKAKRNRWWLSLIDSHIDYPHKEEEEEAIWAEANAGRSSAETTPSW